MGSSTTILTAGSFAVVGGLALIFMPELLSAPAAAGDTFAAVERRIPGGLVLGLGLLFLLHRSLRPLRLTVAAFFLWVMVGALVARFAGLALDGRDSARQWMWIAIEGVVAVATRLYIRSANTNKRDLLLAKSE